MRSQFVGVGLLVLLALACMRAEQGASPGPQAGMATVAAPAAPTPAPGAGERSGEDAKSFTNPVIDQDFPDPDVLKVGDTYYAYATNSGGVNVQVAKSQNLVDWVLLGDALPQMPAWASTGHTWAPDVSTAADGKTYVMYFTARHAESDRQCIGVATSARPEGPFTSRQDKPLICQLDEGGSIDPASFVDEDGTRYVLWKNDGNCCGMDTWVYLQRASPDGSVLEGAPTRLIRGDQDWENFLVEAPTLWKRGGKYYLFYSANNYAGHLYAVGYAVADRIAGPYRKPKDRPLLATSTASGPVIGPGGQDVVVKDGKTWLVYHAWDPNTLQYRSVNVDQLVWDGDQPMVKGPNRVPQPAP